MTARTRLPNRRPNVTTDIVQDGLTFAASIGFDAEGNPAEIFCRCTRPQSAADLAADDLAIVLSVGLQCGIPPLAFAHSIGNKPTTLAARLVALLVEFSDPQKRGAI